MAANNSHATILSRNYYIQPNDFEVIENQNNQHDLIFAGLYCPILKGILEMTSQSTTTPQKPADEKAQPATPANEPVKQPGQATPQNAPEKS